MDNMDIHGKKLYSDVEEIVLLIENYNGDWHTLFDKMSRLCCWFPSIGRTLPGLILGDGLRELRIAICQNEATRSVKIKKTVSKFQCVSGLLRPGQPFEIKRNEK